MRSKQPVLIIVAGLVCATIAVVAVHRAITRANGTPVAAESIEILLARRDIDFGELLTPDGSDANVVFVSGWPKDLTLEGAITRLEQITSQPMRAETSFVKNEPILSSQIAPEAEFVPEGMTRERVSVDEQDIKTGKLRTGMLVDVLRVEGNMPRDFMRNVRIYAIGAVDGHGRPVRSDDPPPTAFLLVKKEHGRAFLEASYKGGFVLVEAADPGSGGPVLVDPSVVLEARRKEGQALLDRGKRLMGEGDYERALGILRDLANEYADVKDLSAEAGRNVTECRTKIANSYCERARLALEEAEDFTAAMRWLDKVEEEFADLADVAAQARELRLATEGAREQQLAQARYSDVLEDLAGALAVGNLPLAEQLMNDLKGFLGGGFTPGAGNPSVAETVQLQQAKVTEAVQHYEVGRQVLESHLKQQDYEKARAKLRQMKEAYPAHPDISELEKLLPAA